MPLKYPIFHPDSRYSIPPFQDLWLIQEPLFQSTKEIPSFASAAAAIASAEATLASKAMAAAFLPHRFASLEKDLKSIYRSCSSENTKIQRFKHVLLAAFFIIGDKQLNKSVKKFTDMTIDIPYINHKRSLD